MTHEVNIHVAQTSILRELLFRPQSGYSELQKPTGLTSDHFNFHIKRLVEIGFVRKVKTGLYALTPRGKEYANKLDTDKNTIERQPKVAVLMAVAKIINGKKHYLAQERLKQPYYGYWGFPTGKIRWGETIIEAANRELKEETGLAADYKIVGTYHEHAYQEENGELLEDKIFFVVVCKNPTGKLIEQFEGGVNRWVTASEFKKKKVYKSFLTELSMAEGKGGVSEETHNYSQEEF